MNLDARPGDPVGPAGRILLVFVRSVPRSTTRPAGILAALLGSFAPNILAFWSFSLLAVWFLALVLRSSGWPANDPRAVPS